MDVQSWLAVATVIGGGLATAAGLIGKSIKYAMDKLEKIRAEERKHEAATVTKFTDTAKEIQEQAAEDNRKAFAAMIEIQRETIKAVAEVSGTVRELNVSVNELRHELTGVREGQQKRKRPRMERSGAEHEKGADD